MCARMCVCVIVCVCVCVCVCVSNRMRSTSLKTGGLGLIWAVVRYEKKTDLIRFIAYAVHKLFQAS